MRFFHLINILTPELYAGFIEFLLLVLTFLIFLTLAYIFDRLITKKPIFPKNYYKKKYKRVNEALEKQLENKNGVHYKYKKNPIWKISIRARVAFGIRCFEKICKEWQMYNGKIPKLIETLWEFTNSNDLSIWEENVGDLRPKSEDEISEYSGNDSLEAHKQKTIFNMFEEVYEIGTGNLYGAFENYCTYEPVMRVVEVLIDNGIELPDLRPFLKSSIKEKHGWGQSVHPSFFDE